ncbi:MAG: hypothetical protein NZ898_06350 [Myxococcota bacterium]|nr:hypothetical protein [Myxococcota bacterium]
MNRGAVGLDRARSRPTISVENREQLVDGGAFEAHRSAREGTARSRRVDAGGRV